MIVIKRTYEEPSFTKNGLVLANFIEQLYEYDPATGKETRLFND